MDNVFLTSKSLTYAQRMERVLRKSGIPAAIERADLAISERGCAYAVVVSEGYFAEVTAVLRYNGLMPVKAVMRDEKGNFKVLSV